MDRTCRETANSLFTFSESDKFTTKPDSGRGAEPKFRNDLVSAFEYFPKSDGIKSLGSVIRYCFLLDLCLLGQLFETIG